MSRGCCGRGCGVDLSPTRPLVGSPFVGGGCCVEFCEQVGDVVAAKVAAHVDGGALAVGGVTGDGGDAVELPKFTGALARVQRLPLYGGGGVLHHVPRLAGADCFDGVAFGLVEVEQHVVAEPFVTQPLGRVDHAVAAHVAWQQHLGKAVDVLGPERLWPKNEAARPIRRHFAEIVAYFEHPYTNAVLEDADKRHPEREETGPRLPQHGLLRHHDLPDLRQTRPQSRHHRLTTTHHKQRITEKTLPIKAKVNWRA